MLFPEAAAVANVSMPLSADTPAPVRMTILLISLIPPLYPRRIARSREANVVSTSLGTKG
jgi:hypothetical protein